MRSYEERILSFSGWPETYKPVFIRKLAIIGQYAQQQSTTLCTTCIFCNKKLEDWKITDDPFTEHSKHNNKCPLFELGRSGSRLKIALASGYKPDSEHAKIISTPVYDEITKTTNYPPVAALMIKKGIPFIFCLICGSNSKNHVCKSKVKPADKRRKREPQYWQLFFSGQYNDVLEDYIRKDILIPEDKKDGFREILSFCNEVRPTDTVESAFRKCMDAMTEAFSNDLKNFEDNLIEDIKRKYLTIA